VSPSEAEAVSTPEARLSARQKATLISTFAKTTKGPRAATRVRTRLPKTAKVVLVRSNGGSRGSADRIPANIVISQALTVIKALTAIKARTTIKASEIAMSTHDPGAIGENMAM
jgi:hypothetical protein